MQVAYSDDLADQLKSLVKNLGSEGQRQELERGGFP